MLITQKVHQKCVVADTLAKLAVAGGAIAGGYALGKSIGSGATGTKRF